MSLRFSSEEASYGNTTSLVALAEILGQIKADPEIRVLILEGGQRSFFHGASKEFLVEAELPEIASVAGDVPRLILSLPIPTIAAMSGHAVGGALILGLCCDIPLLAEEALYGVNFLTLGFTPGLGATAILEDSVGAPLARELLFTGRLYKGRYFRGGPLNKAILPRAEVLNRAMSIASEIGRRSPAAVQMLKDALSSRRRHRLEAALAEEREMHKICFSDPQVRATIAARY